MVWLATVSKQDNRHAMYDIRKNIEFRRILTRLYLEDYS